MPKFTPKISNKKYNLKLIAIIDGKTNVYTYIDDDGDQMLVRVFDDEYRMPYMKGKLSLKLNPKTDRKYTVLEVTEVGTKEDFNDIEIPESWKKGSVKTGDALRSTIKNAVDEAIQALEDIDDAADVVEDQWQHITHDESFRLTSKSRERIREKAEDKAWRACQPFFTMNLEELYNIMEAV